MDLWLLYAYKLETSDGLIAMHMYISLAQGLTDWVIQEYIEYVIK